MKVLQLVQRPSRRGAEVFAYDLTRRFEQLGIAVKTVYLYSANGERELPLHGLDICLEGRGDHYLERFPKLVPSLLKGVLNEIRSFGPDIVQVNGSRTVKYGAVAKRLSGRPSWKLIYRNIGIPSDWHHWWGSVFMYRRAIMPQMDGVIGVSRYSLDDAKSLYGLNVPTEVIPNGISPGRLTTTTARGSFREARGVGPDDPVLLFVGFLDENKRPEWFVRAVARVASEMPRTQGWIVGEGPYKKRAEALADSLGLGDRIKFFGPQDDVASFMQAADVLIMTSQTEGIPAVILEAGYMGLPVVATRVGGLPECVLEGETGMLVDPDSEVEMAREIRRLAVDSELRSRMGDNARRWVQSNLMIEQVADRYLEFYRKLQGNEIFASVEG